MGRGRRLIDSRRGLRHGVRGDPSRLTCRCFVYALATPSLLCGRSVGIAPVLVRIADPAPGFPVQNLLSSRISR